jgi:orotate phosphoribosyltransferase
MGGLIIGHEMGRALGVDAMFVERPTGTFELRRGFSLNPGDKVLMVEDVVTTGLSSREAIKAIEEAGGGRRGRPRWSTAARVSRSGRALLPADRAQLPDLAADELPARAGRHARDQAGQPRQAVTDLLFRTPH